MEAVLKRDAANEQLRSEASIMISETKKQAMQAIMNERSEFQKRETNLLSETDRLRNALAQSEVTHAQVETNAIKHEGATHGTELQSQILELKNEMAFTIERVAQIQGSVEELISRSQLLETRIVALENWEVPTIPVYEDALEELDEDKELIPDLNLPPRG